MSNLLLVLQVDPWIPRQDASQTINQSHNVFVAISEEKLEISGEKSVQIQPRYIQYIQHRTPL